MSWPGTPAVWLEWRQDPYYHTARDTYAHCKPALVRRTGEMLLGFLYKLTESDLESLAAARQSVTAATPARMVRTYCLM